MTQETLSCFKNWGKEKEVRDDNIIRRVNSSNMEEWKMYIWLPSEMAESSGIFAGCCVAHEESIASLVENVMLGNCCSRPIHRLDNKRNRSSSTPWKDQQQQPSLLSLGRVGYMDQLFICFSENDPVMLKSHSSPYIWEKTRQTTHEETLKFRDGTGKAKLLRLNSRSLTWTLYLSNLQVMLNLPDYGVNLPF